MSAKCCHKETSRGVHIAAVQHTIPKFDLKVLSSWARASTLGDIVRQSVLVVLRLTTAHLRLNSPWRWAALANGILPDLNIYLFVSIWIS
jgi:hypothetical protein